MLIAGPNFKLLISDLGGVCMHFYKVLISFSMIEKYLKDVCKLLLVFVLLKLSCK